LGGVGAGGSDAGAGALGRWGAGALAKASSQRRSPALGLAAGLSPRRRVAKLSGGLGGRGWVREVPTDLGLPRPGRGPGGPWGPVRRGRRGGRGGRMRGGRRRRRQWRGCVWGRGRVRGEGRRRARRLAWDGRWPALWRGPAVTEGRHHPVRMAPPGGRARRFGRASVWASFLARLSVSRRVAGPCARVQVEKGMHQWDHELRLAAGAVRWLTGTAALQCAASGAPHSSAASAWSSAAALPTHTRTSGAAGCACPASGKARATLPRLARPPGPGSSCSASAWTPPCGPTSSRAATPALQTSRWASWRWTFRGWAWTRPGGGRRRLLLEQAGGLRGMQQQLVLAAR
jgi:hypothetical protein